MHAKVQLISTKHIFSPSDTQYTKINIITHKNMRYISKNIPYFTLYPPQKYTPTTKNQIYFHTFAL